MAPAYPGWWVDEAGRKSWPVSAYPTEGLRITDWFTIGVVTQHRTIGTTLSALIETGFVIQRVQEFASTLDQIAENRNLAEEMERSTILLIAAQ